MPEHHGLDPNEEAGLNGDPASGYEVEPALAELFHRPQPNPAFVHELEQRLQAAKPEGRRASSLHRFFQTLAASIPALAWGAAGLALILVLAWTINTLIPTPSTARPSAPLPQAALPPAGAANTTGMAEATPAPASTPVRSLTPKPLTPTDMDGQKPSSDFQEGFASLSGGGKLAFIQDGALWVKPLNGQSKRLTEAGSHPCWSPGGDWLAFRKGDEQAWVIGEDGSGARALNGGKKVGAFDWSPARDELAYVAGSGELRLADASGKDQRALALPPGSAAIQRFAWSPDGNWIAFQVIQRKAGKEPPYAAIWRVSLDGSRPVELVSGNPILAGWTGNGRALLFWDGGETFSASLLADGVPLMLVPAKGGTQQKLVKSALVYDDFVRLDPSGSGRVAVVSGGDREAWTNKLVFEFDGTNSSLVSSSELAASSPAWSPDGEQVAYAAAPDAGKLGGGEDARQALMKRRIWARDFQTGKTRQVTASSPYRDEYPLWSGDGQNLLFIRMDGQSRASLWLVPAAGGTPSLIVDEMDVPAAASGDGWFGYYGHIDWPESFDWWR